MSISSSRSISVSAAAFSLLSGFFDPVQGDGRGWVFVVGLVAVVTLVVVMVVAVAMVEVVGEMVVVVMVVVEMVFVVNLCWRWVDLRSRLKREGVTFYEKSLSSIRQGLYQMQNQV
jgi:hypothetical protein